MSTRKTLANKTVDTHANSVAFAFTDAETVTVALSDLPESIIQRLALHGLSQKVGDSYSGSGGEVETAVAMAKRTIENLSKGSWGVERAGGSGRGLALYIEAMARLTGKTTEEVVAVVDQLTDEQTKELKKRPDVRGMVDIIKAERAKAVVETSDLGAMFG